MRCYSSWFSLRFRRFPQPYSLPLSSVRRFSELSEIIEVSISCQLVFELSFEIFSQTVRIRLIVHKSAKCQNIHTAQNLPRSLSFFFCSSDLGLDSAGPWLFAVIKRLDCAPSSLCSPFGAKVRSFLPLSKITVLFTFVQASSSLRLPETTNDCAIVQPAEPVKNLQFLLKTAIQSIKTPFLLHPKTLDH
jgi:hypothetical protein